MSRDDIEAVRGKEPAVVLKTGSNMGPASKQEIEHYAAYVLAALYLDDSCMKWTTAGDICIPPDILIDEHHIGQYRWQTKEAVLHEIAHLFTWSQDMKHGRWFYQRYAELLIDWMV